MISRRRRSRTSRTAASISAKLKQSRRNVGDGDATLFYNAWSAAADRRVQQAQQAQAAGHRESARALLFKSACFYGISYRPLFGTPVNSRVTAAFNSQMDAFAKAAAMLDAPATTLQVQYESTTLPAYSFAAERGVDHRDPLLIFTSGYDTTFTDSYFGSIVAATRRGYDCFAYDGPGQGAPLIRDGLPMRPDWENVVGPVIDFIKVMPEYSERPLVLLGWSFGGYLALRAAALPRASNHWRARQPAVGAVIVNPDSIRMMAASSARLSSRESERGEWSTTLRNATALSYSCASSKSNRKRSKYARPPMARFARRVEIGARTHRNDRKPQLCDIGICSRSLADDDDSRRRRLDRAHARRHDAVPP
jgi:pimeloyl-ACP methyl ester carboxylesterase